MRPNTAYIGSKESKEPPADLANQSRKPTFLRPAAIGTKVPNQVKTFQAGLLARKSAQAITLAKTIAMITIKAVVVGLTPKKEDPIQRTSAPTEMRAMAISLPVIAPNLAYSSLAHSAISGEPLTSGLQKT